MSTSELDNVNDGDNLIDYLNNFVDCYDGKLTMFLKVRAMILALNDAMPKESTVPFEKNSIGVNEFTDKLKTKYKELKKEYMKKEQTDRLNFVTSYIGSQIVDLMSRFCNKGIDLTNGFGIYDGDKPKSMFQTLLLEIMLGNFVTKKIIEAPTKTPEGSPATTVVQYSPSSPFSSDFDMSTTREDYMQSPMLVTGKTIGNDINASNPLTITERNEKLNGEINNINSDNYHKVHSASKFWSLFRDHYNENCEQLQGEINSHKPEFKDTNTFYNQKVKNMQIIWKNVMLLKKRRQELYILLNSIPKDDKGGGLKNTMKGLPRNIDYAVNINNGKEDGEEEAAKIKREHNNVQN